MILPFDTISQLDNPIPLDMGEPSGGVYFLGSNQEIITSLQPSLLEAGEYWLYYEFSDGNGCLGVDSAQFFVTEPQQMVFAPELDVVCQNFGLLELPDGTPEGGIWSGEFVSNNTFDTEQAGSGDFWLSYTVELQNGFFQSDSAMLRVLPLTFTELSVILCEGSVYEIDDETFTESGLYTIILGEAANGCDSVLYLDLNIGHPDLTITQDIVVFLDENGEVSISPDDVYNSTLSGWNIESMILDIQDFSCEDIGENEVYLSIADENGNQACGTAIVTVEDNLLPVVITQNIVIQLDETGEASITPADIDNGSYDNCGIESMELDVEFFTLGDVGENTVSLTVFDVNGNSASENAIVTVLDFIADTYNLTLVVEPQEGGTVDGDGQYEAEEEITLTAVASEGYVFLRWEDEDGTELSTETQFVFTMPDSDVTLTAFFDLENTVGDVISSHLKLFPNPATEQVNIRAGFMINTLRIMDITGKAVYVSNSVHSDEYQLNVSGFEPGIYLVSLQHDKGVVTVRLMISR